MDQLDPLNENNSIISPIAMDINILVVLYDYIAQHTDELSLIKFQKVKVLSRDPAICGGDEGWWTGVNLSTDNKKSGLFPSNYVGVITTSNTSSSTSEVVCRSISTSITRKINLKRDEDQLLPPHIPYVQLEFKDCIGAGGFGKVYRGFWMKLNDINRYLN